MNVSSVKNLNGETFSAVQDATLTDVVQSNSGNWNEISAYQNASANYLTAVDLTPYYTTADANTLSSMLSGAVDYVSANAGGEFPASADNAIQYLQELSGTLLDSKTLVNARYNPNYPQFEVGTKAAVPNLIEEYSITNFNTAGPQAPTATINVPDNPNGYSLMSANIVVESQIPQQIYLVQNYNPNVPLTRCQYTKEVDGNSATFNITYFDNHMGSSALLGIFPPEVSNVEGTAYYATSYTYKELALKEDIPSGGNPEVESYVTTNSGNIDDTVNNVTTNSGAWGGSALPISAGPGVKFEMINGTLIVSNDETVLFFAGNESSGVQSGDLSESIMNFERIRVAGMDNDGHVDVKYIYPAWTKNADGFSTSGYEVMLYGANPYAVQSTVWEKWTRYSFSALTSFNIVLSYEGSYTANAVSDVTNSHKNSVREVVGINRIAGGN